MASTQPKSSGLQEDRDLELQMVTWTGISDQIVGLNDNIDNAVPLHISEVEGGGEEPPVRVVTRMSSKRKAPVPDITDDAMNVDQSHESDKDGGAAEEPPGGMLTRAGSKRRALAVACLEEMLIGVRLNGPQRIANSCDEAPSDKMVIRVNSKRKAPSTDFIEEKLSQISLVGSQGCEDAGCDGISADGPCRSKKMKKNIAGSSEKVLPVGKITRTRSKSKAPAIESFEGMIARLKGSQKSEEAGCDGNSADGPCRSKKMKKNIARNSEKVLPVGKTPRTRFKSKTPAIESFESMIARLKGSQKSGKGKRDVSGHIPGDTNDMVPVRRRRKWIDIDPISKYTISTRSSSKYKKPPIESVDAPSGRTQRRSKGLRPIPVHNPRTNDRRKMNSKEVRPIAVHNPPTNDRRKMRSKGRRPIAVHNPRTNDGQTMNNVWTFVQQPDLKRELLEKEERMFCCKCLRTLEQIDTCGGHMVATGCGHVTCNKCLTHAVKSSGKCPACRHKLRPCEFQELLM